MEGRVAALCYNGLEAEYERDEADLRGSMSEYEGIASIVRRMLGLDFTHEQIAQATSLSPDAIEALRDNRP